MNFFIGLLLASLVLILLQLLFVHTEHGKTLKLLEDVEEDRERLRSKYKDLFWDMQKIRTEHPEYFL